MSRNIGYARVSHRDQNEARQIIALKREGLDDADIYMDKLSGKDFNRPQYQRMLKEAKEGDCIFILSIDRLGRNYEEMIEQWNYITKGLKVDIAVLDMPLLDTRKEKNLIGAFISDFVLYISFPLWRRMRELISRRDRLPGLLQRRPGALSLAGKERNFRMSLWRLTRGGRIS